MDDVTQPATEPDDPYLWLEEVTDERALAWVHEQNRRTDAELSAAPGFEDLRRDLQAILDSDDKIPYVRQVGDHLYNFWQDAEHERGLWRRTTWDEYRKPEPAWETVIDLDELSAAEGERWVWHGASFLRPTDPDGEWRLCLVALSRGGSDADVTREFDVVKKEFVTDGFLRPEAKGRLGWIDDDHVFVGTDFGPGSMTASGYPRIARRWTRGTPLEDAETVFEGSVDDVWVYAGHDDTPGFERDFVVRGLTFFTDELYLLDADGTPMKIDVPDSANKSVHREWLLVRPREDWTVGGTTYVAGSLLATPLDDYLAGDRTLDVLFKPDARTSLESWTWTRSHLVLNTLEDVKTRLYVLTPGADGWARRPLDGAPAVGTVDVGAVDADESDAVWMTVTDFLTPTTLAVTDLGSHGESAPEPEVLKRTPEVFDATGLTTEQRFATSEDGTRVPYFLVRPVDLAMDGSAPTLLYGYGGFEVSLTPAYLGLTGRGWVQGGGVYVVANIRGGGEYGPEWHRAALKEHRHRAYEDLIAVAEDLVATGVTSPKHLGVAGGSNGGLLAGNMLVRRPDLFGAVVSYVPLLDMRRYHRLLAGASWVAEYGDPDDPEQWEYIAGFSPYHLLQEGTTYPPTLIWTTTRDDRVHPGHARKMAARMLELGQDVRYFENTEGGHGAGATNAQTAHVWALHHTFLRSALGRA